MFQMVHFVETRMEPILPLLRNVIGYIFARFLLLLLDVQKQQTENFKTLSKNIQELWEKLYKIISYYPFSRTKWIVVKKNLKKKKLEPK